MRGGGDWKRSYGASYAGTKGETPDTAKDDPASHRTSPRPYQGSEYGLHAAAIAEFNAGRAPEAERLARSLLSNREHTAYREAARLTLAEALFEQERYADARVEFEALLGKGLGDDGQRHCALRVAWCLFFAGEHDAAWSGDVQVVDTRHLRSSVTNVVEAERVRTHERSARTREWVNRSR